MDRDERAVIRPQSSIEDHSRAVLVRFFGMVRPYWPQLAKLMLLSLAANTLSLLAPYLTRVLIDNAYPVRDVSLMTVLILCTFLFALVGTFVTTIKAYLAHVLTSTLTRALTLEVFDHIQQLPDRFFTHHQAGDITSRVTDVKSAVSALAHSLQSLLSVALHSLAIPALLIYMHPRLGVVAIAVTPLSLAISVLSAKALRRYWHSAAEASADSAAYLNEVIVNARGLRLLNAQSQLRNRAAQLLDKSVGSQLRAHYLGTLSGLLVALVNASGAAALSWYAWLLVMKGDLTLGTFIAFTAYTALVTSSLTQITGGISLTQQVAVVLRRIFEILDEPVEDSHRIQGFVATPPSSRGTIQAVDTDFGYTRDRPILVGINLIIKTGEPLAIVGRSGAGKSSLFRVLGGTERPINGEVFVGGLSIDVWPFNQLRRHVVLVNESMPMMKATLLENLTLGSPDAPINDVWSVLRLCRLDSFVLSLPGQLQAHLTEWGATLSAGQRQRIALARAVLADPEVLLMDEATAQLDVATEMGIMRDLLRRRRQKTTAFITHRPRTAALAETVVFMDEGRITGIGPHETLLRTNTQYQSLFAKRHKAKKNISAAV